MGPVNHVIEADDAPLVAISLADLAERLDLDVAIVAELLQVFIDASSDDLESLIGALEDGDPKAVVTSAHSIKGAALNLGLEDLAAIARMIEMKAGAGTLDGIASTIPELSRKLSAASIISDHEETG